MGDFAEKAGRLKRTWVTGATVLLLLVLVASVVGCAVAIALGVVSEIFDWREGMAELWLAVTGAVWLPLAIGSLCRLFSFRNIIALGGDELDKYRSR